MELEEFNSLNDTRKPVALLGPAPVAKPFIHAGTHVVYLMDPRTGDVQKRHFGPDQHLGAIED
jgi:hypothetical protein